MTRPFDAIVFDAFGTLVHIGQPTRPYAQARLALEGRGGQVEGFARQAMTTRLPLEALARQSGAALSTADLNHYRELTQTEVASVVPFADAGKAIEAALQHADRVIVGSNLATPYGTPVEAWLRQWGRVQPLGKAASSTRLLTAFSFDVGHVKPEPAFYAWVARALAKATKKPVEELKIAMVGDKQAEDCDGPALAGWQSHRLDRKAGQTLLDAPWWPKASGVPSLHARRRRAG